MAMKAAVKWTRAWAQANMDTPPAVEAEEEIGDPVDTSLKSLAFLAACHEVTGREAAALFEDVLILICDLRERLASAEANIADHERRLVAQYYPIWVAPVAPPGLPTCKTAQVTTPRTPLL